MRNLKSRNFILKRLGEEFFQVHKKTNLPTIDNGRHIICYHYTTYKGLLGIIKSKEIWCTDYKKLADRTEINYGNEIIYEILQSENKKDEGLWADVLTCYVSDIQKGMGVFVSSYCTDPDYLPAWRYHADEGGGFCIGFKFVLEEDSSNDSLQMLASKVIYEEAEFRGYIQELLRIAKKFKKEKGRSKGTKREIDRYLLNSLVSFLPCYKKSDFSSEKEMRLYYQYIQWGDEFFPVKIPSEKIVKHALVVDQNNPFLIVDTELIERYRHSFNVGEIVEIYVGPRCEFNKAKIAIQEILDENGFNSKNVQIKESTHPYR